MFTILIHNFCLQLLFTTFVENFCSQLLSPLLFTNFVLVFFSQYFPSQLFFKTLVHIPCLKPLFTTLCSQLFFTLFVNNFCSNFFSQLLFIIFDDIFSFQLFFTTLFNWHECAAFQSVGVWAADWHYFL